MAQPTKLTMRLKKLRSAWPTTSHIRFLTLFAVETKDKMFFMCTAKTKLNPSLIRMFPGHKVCHLKFLEARF